MKRQRKLKKVQITTQKKHLTNNKVADGVKAQNARTPRFYKKSKIYKGRIPGKPVISSVNCQS